MFFLYEDQAAVRLGPWKYVRDPRDRLGGQTHGGEYLYRLDHDPAESHNLTDRHPEVRNELAALVDDWLRDVDSWRLGAQHDMAFR